MLIHGDAHARNLLLKPDPAGGSTSSRLIDPEGLLSEPAHDLGVALRDGNEELPPTIPPQRRPNAASRRPC